jgi:hypothetical protein
MPVVVASRRPGVSSLLAGPARSEPGVEGYVPSCHEAR